MVVDIGEVKQFIKPKADSTLRNMRKDDLLKYIRCLEHNYNVAVSFNENQAKYIESLGVNAQKWIPVEERMPEDGTKVLALAKNGRISECNCVKSYVERFGNYEQLTHWMPLPNPPKEVHADA